MLQQLSLPRQQFSSSNSAFAVRPRSAGKKDVTAATASLLLQSSELIDTHLESVCSIDSSERNNLFLQHLLMKECAGAGGVAAS